MVGWAMGRVCRAILCAIGLTVVVTVSAHVRASEPAWQVCFTPGQDCTRLIVSEIGDARSEILVQAYSFTSVPIISALKAAHDRGVDVMVIVDKTSARVSKSGSRYSGATYLTNAGIPVWVDTTVSIAHNKTMILDRSTVITRSFNFTAAAQNHNAENLLVIRDSNLAGEYRT
jgi:phosphatidylserine/phosphatidylglycerophosphate/cardiolipin synthase-like enzyme